MKPTIGRIVHYVLPTGEHRPAIIVRVWPEEFLNNPDETTGLNLQVFLDGTNDNEAYRGMELPVKIDPLHGTLWATSAKYTLTATPDGSVSQAGTWHWPEKAEE